jgi:hypothetical protein
MYLHPLIHGDLIGQHERELSRLPLRGGRGLRSLPGKKAAAALGALLAATTAALALTSGALAATAKKPAHPATTAKDASWRIVQDATGKITIRIGGRIVYTYYPAPAHPLISTSTDTSSDCANYQTNCTNEQTCQYWGVCNQITTTGNDAQTATQDSSSGDSASNGPGQSDSTSLEPMPEVVSDNTATQSVSDTAANLSDTSQNDQDC